MKTIRIATRNSPLALYQANFVSSMLQKHRADIKTEIVGMTTRGDANTSVALSEIGGKALFIKELEHSLLNRETDIAVHSMKDVPAHLPDGLCIGAIMQRVDPRDALVSKTYKSLSDLPAGALLGTSSLRRRCQIKNQFPDLRIKPLRGNIGTRLDKLERGEYDAIILACAGLLRMNITDYFALPTATCLPAIGQGALGIECLTDNQSMLRLISTLNSADTELCVNTEREVSSALGGDCQMPLAVYAKKDEDKLSIEARLGDVETSELLYASSQASVQDSQSPGAQVAKDLIDQGALEIIRRNHLLD